MSFEPQALAFVLGADTGANLDALRLSLGLPVAPVAGNAFGETTGTHAQPHRGNHEHAKCHEQEQRNADEDDRERDSNRDAAPERRHEEIIEPCTAQMQQPEAPDA